MTTPTDILRVRRYNFEDVPENVLRDLEALRAECGSYYGSIDAFWWDEDGVLLGFALQTWSECCGGGIEVREMPTKHVLMRSAAACGGPGYYLLDGQDGSFVDSLVDRQNGVWSAIAADRDDWEEVECGVDASDDLYVSPTHLPKASVGIYIAE